MNWFKTTYSQINKVLGHIGGPSGSGKTTLLNELSIKYPQINFKDLDEFDDEACYDLGYFEINKDDFNDQMLKELADKRQELMDNYIKESKKPIVFGGYHTEDKYVLDIPTNNRWLLNTDAKTSAKRAYQRSLKEEPRFRRLESELPQDTQEAEEYINFLKSNNYQPLSAEEISQKVGNYV